jgi:hypothetical protein
MVSEIELSAADKTSAYTKHKSALTQKHSRLSPSTTIAIEQTVDNLFPKGWDSSLDTTHIYSHTVKARHGHWTEPDNNIVEAVAIPDKGKFRIITKPHWKHDRFKYLQKALWKRIRKSPLMVVDGPLTDSHLDSLTNDGDWISGDYSAATDNLNINVPYTILSRILERSVRLTEAQKQDALDEVGRHLVKYPDNTTITQSSGQLMGSLLSFPLLCIANLATLPADTPCLINGDDILFRGTKHSFTLWKTAARRVGFILNERKTYIHPRFATMNSQCILDGKIHSWANLKMARHWDGSAFLQSGLSIDTYKRRVQQYQRAKKLPKNTRDLCTPTAQGGLGGTTEIQVPLTMPSQIGHYGKLLNKGWLPGYQAAKKLLQNWDNALFKKQLERFHNQQYTVCSHFFVRKCDVWPHKSFNKNDLETGLKFRHLLSHPPLCAPTV